MPQSRDPGDWRSLTTKQRCAVIGRVASEISEAATSLTRLSRSPQRIDPVETITAELLPLCSALRYIKKRGSKTLRDQRVGVSGRPAWLWGVRSTVRRAPRGQVLILGTWNYPLFLPGVQAAQALAAGNHVILKPAAGCEAVTEAMVEAFVRAGVPRAALQQLPSHPQAAIEAIDRGVDLIVLTGSAATGRKVLAQAARTVTPSIVELSGCDAVVVLPGADIERTAKSILFGLTFNSGATCIGPRRILAEPLEASELADCLRDQLAECEPMQVHPAARKNLVNLIQAALDSGARDVTGKFNPAHFDEHGSLRPLILDRVNSVDAIASSDIFAPVCSLIHLANIRQAIPIINGSDYRLAASVFGPAAEAKTFADELQVGSVCINDLIVPTADPRLPFGGRGQSGFGVTRGREGLLAMTVPTVISQRRGRFAPHLQPRQPSDAQTLTGALQLLHGGTLGKRVAGIRKMIAAGSKRSPQQEPDDAEGHVVASQRSETTPDQQTAAFSDAHGRNVGSTTENTKNESHPMENERTS